MSMQVSRKNKSFQVASALVWSTQTEDLSICVEHQSADSTWNVEDTRNMDVKRHMYM